jgi:hypothetical protein
MSIRARGAPAKGIRTPVGSSVKAKKANARRRALAFAEKTALGNFQSAPVDQFLGKEVKG